MCSIFNLRVALNTLYETSNCVHNEVVFLFPLPHFRYSYWLLERFPHSCDAVGHVDSHVMVHLKKNNKKNKEHKQQSSCT